MCEPRRLTTQFRMGAIYHGKPADGLALSIVCNQGLVAEEDLTCAIITSRTDYSNNSPLPHAASAQKRGSTASFRPIRMAVLQVRPVVSIACHFLSLISEL